MSAEESEETDGEEEQESEYPMPPVEWLPRSQDDIRRGEEDG
jgi:hypothetical protein